MPAASVGLLFVSGQYSVLTAVRKGRIAVATDAVMAAGMVVFMALIMVALHLHVHGAGGVVVRIGNRIVVRLLRAGVPLGSLIPAGTMMLLTVAGRKTGIDRTTPVDLFQMDGRRWVIQTHGAGEGASNWVRNLRVAGEATVARGGRAERYSAVELSEQEAAAVLEKLLAPVAASRFRKALLGHALPAGRTGTDGHFAATARSHAVFELAPLPITAELGDARQAA
jgi:deazaflavin-dependent oxidoreductase (nitroreductase family)